MKEWLVTYDGKQGMLNHIEVIIAQEEQGHHRRVPDVPGSAVVPHKPLCFR